MSLVLESVVRFGSALQRATSLRELVETTYQVIRSETRYRTAWLAVLRANEPDYMHVIQVVGTAGDIILEKCPPIPLAGDAMVTAVVEGKSPVIVLDAAMDPRTNKEIVASLGNRTIVNVPLVLGPTVIGTLGVGSFGDEGVMAPTEAELDSLVMVGALLAGAITRLQLVEQQQREAMNRRELERMLESMQRLELMSVLSAGVAHDLNNYLMAVRANLELLRDGEADPGESVGQALFATERSTMVVRQLLALGRSATPRREVLDLGERVTSTLKLVRGAIPRAVHVSHTATSSVTIKGDPVQVEQAIANLLLNARDAVEPGGKIEVDVAEAELGEEALRLAPSGRPGRYGRVLVHDTGKGIAPDVLPHIFDPLFTTKHTGTGLGLAVVSRVAEQHGGLVTCESAAGKGTTFSLYLPAAAAIGAAQAGD